MNTVPTKFLYIGAAGEHYVISECFRNNMEAFKLPIDKGFDLVVTRAYVHLADAGASGVDTADKDETPIYLQVKSRQVILAPPASASERPKWEGSFLVKRADLDLICKTRNSALACVLFVENRGAFVSSRTTYAWWMSSAYVQKLWDSKHFIDRGPHQDLELWVRYSEPASDTTFDQNLYIALRKQSGSAGAQIGDLASGNLLDRGMFDFGRLGTT